MKTFAQFISEAKVNNLIDEIKNVRTDPISDDKIPVNTKKDTTLKPSSVKEDYADLKILYSSKISDILDDIKDLAQNAIDTDINAEAGEYTPFIDWKGIHRTLEDVRDSFTISTNISDDEADDNEDMEESQEFPSFRNFLSLKESEQLDEVSSERLNQYVGKAFASKHKANQEMKDASLKATEHEAAKNKLIRKKVDYSGPATQEKDARAVVSKAHQTLLKRSKGMNTAAKKLAEGFKPGIYKCKDNSSINLSKNESDLLNSSLSGLSDSEKSLMISSKQNLADAIALAKEMK